MSKKPIVLICAGFLLLFLSYYGSSAMVTTNLERNVKFTFTTTKPVTETLLVQPIAQDASPKNTFILNDYVTSQPIVKLTNNGNQEITVTMDFYLNPDQNGNHWKLQVRAAGTTNEILFDHKQIKQSLTFTIEAGKTQMIDIVRGNSGNSSDKDISLRATVNITANDFKDTLLQKYRIEY